MKRLVRFRVHIGLLATLSALALMASATPQKRVVAPYQPNFKYATQTPAAPGSASVALGIVSPSWGKDMDRELANTPELKKFNAAVTSSITELATAKGMNVKGPFSDYGEMTFSDKKTIALVIQPTFEFATVYEPKVVAKGTNAWGIFECEARLRYGLEGHVTLKISEPMSQQFLWQKKVDLDSAATTFNWEGTSASCPPDTFSSKWFDDTNMNNYRKATEAAYQSLMSNLDKYLVAEEMQMLDKQAQEIKSKKVF